MDLFNNHNIIPMLLSEAKTPFNDKDFIFELKLDGTRTLIYAEPDAILIKNRRGAKLNATYPELLNIKKNVKKKVIFDGEIILMHEGKPSFEKLQLRSHLKDKKKINYYQENMPVVFVAYDILYDGEDITDLPLTQRKKRLDKYPDNEYFIKTKYLFENGIDFYKETKRLGLEGIVAKHKESTYKINKRTSEWIKIKNLMKESFKIYGYQETLNGISVLLIDDNDKYVGRVSIASSNPDSKIVKKTPINPKAKIIKEGFINIKPNLRCNVEFMDKTKSGALRQPIYRGLN